MPAIAKSPRRRANSRKAQRRPTGHGGSLISVRISSAARDVVSEPSKKSDALSIRRPCGPMIVSSASQRNRGTVGGSLAHADPAAEMPGIAITEIDRDARLQGAHPLLVEAVRHVAHYQISHQR